MSNQENSQQLSQDVSIPVRDSENGAKDDEKSKNASDVVEKSAAIDDLPSYEHATTDATPAYSVSDPSHQHSDPSAVASKQQRRGPSRLTKCCCLISILIAIAIILAVISKTNSNLCNNINIDAINPNTTSFDPNFYALAIDSSDTANQNGGFLSLGTSQNTSPGVTNVTVNTRIASPKQGNAYFTDSFSGPNYNLIFHQKSTSSRNFFNLFGPPDSCFRAHVDLVWPQQSTSPVALNVDNFDVHLANLSSNQSINVHTITGNIFMRNLNISNANLYSEKASIRGRRVSLSNTLIVNQTSNGEVELFINIVPNATNPKIYINANNGHVRLILNKTFAGTYNVMTSGKVMFSESRRKPISLPAQGTYGNGTALLEVISNSDVRIGF